MNLSDKEKLKNKLNAKIDGSNVSASIQDDDDFEMSLQKNSRGQSMAVQSFTGRYMQEVQGMVFMAKQYPRDQFDSWRRIKEACARKSLAEVAEYEYPRGGKRVSGPSIRLAEVLAQCWGNISHGVIELEQRQGESTAMAFAWDLETNTRVEKIFTVKHERKAQGRIDKLSDPRDVYELIANMGARRQRACILSVIPMDVTDKACEECEITLKGGAKEPLTDRIRRMLDKFNEFGVVKEMIETRVGYTLDLFTEKDLAGLIKVYNSLKDGMGTREDFFDVTKGTSPVASDNPGDNSGTSNLFDEETKK